MLVKRVSLHERSGEWSLWPCLDFGSEGFRINPSSAIAAYPLADVGPLWLGVRNSVGAGMIAIAGAILVLAC